MKNLYWVLFLTVICPAISFAATEDLANHIVGTYRGGVSSGGDITPLSTIFFINRAGKLNGKYEMEEETGPATGELANFRIENTYTVLVDWTDKYGSGLLRLYFSPDRDTFYGFWGNAEVDTDMPWYGVREYTSEQEK